MSDVLVRLITELPPERRAYLVDLLQPAPEPVAIVGLACRFPGADTPDAFWHLLHNGVDAIGEFPAHRLGADALGALSPDSPARWGGFLADVDRFDASFFGIARREAETMDPRQRLLLEATWEALEDAGYAPSSLAGSQAGIFIGMASAGSEYANLGLDPSEPTALTGNYPSVASGRLSYLLGVHGPSLVVDTACSAALVAVHLACMSLRQNECTLALVGGVNLILSPAASAAMEQVMPMARDGRCKTFDARADGFVRGEGCGVIVLKRLSRARADGDTIRAVIRGSAVNQDGRSSGLTAPNGAAQEAVVRAALAQARVEPGRVSYVEAHGTATALGDPIELEALGAVLGQGRAPGERLAIGSVKTNIGHLEAAAGIAGLLKVVLSLQHQEIPPHLHWREPNRLVAWAALPLWVPTSPTPWPANGMPRVAGLNSFGFSGTNAHLVVEEAPPAREPASSWPWHVLPLSAKTGVELERASTRLGTHLAEHTDLPLADVAYTLQVGRSSFDHRQVVVCHDLHDAAEALQRRDPRRLLTGHITDATATRAVAFMFSGLGDHYVNMGLGLYQSATVFREHVDRCADLLRPQLDLDLRDVLYPAPVRHGEAPVAEPSTGLDLRQMLGRGGPVDEATKRLNQTALAQPATFVVEYAAAQLWLSWGIRPRAMIGYSIGEYVAACLAGVLGLEDALALVARRGQLIQELPGGAMLAVPLPEEELRPLLGSGLSLSAVNGPSLCVVGGPADDVAALHHQLTARGLACRLLQTSHAFHSRMMEPIVPTFRALVRTLTLRPPATPFVSNVTGRWITAAEATDPEYWVRHLCQTVRFGEGVAELWRTEGQILLEVGPGQTLCSLALQHPACEQAAARVALPSLRPAYDRQSDAAFLQGTVGQLWLAGVDVDWEAYHHGGHRRRVPLPTYPFTRQRYWIERAEGMPAPSGPVVSRGPAMGVADWISAVSASKKPDRAEWFYLPLWRQAPPRLGTIGVPSIPASCWLIFVDAGGFAEQLAGRLQQSGQTVVCVTACDHYERLDAHSYSINPRHEAEYATLLDDMRSRGQTPTRILYAWSLQPDGSTSGAGVSAPDQHTGFYGLLFLLHALEARVFVEQLQVWVLGDGLLAVMDTDPLRPEKALMLGLCAVLPQEYAATTCRVIDVLEPPPRSRPGEDLLQQVLAELAAPSADHVVAYRGSQRWVRTFEAVRLEAPAALPGRLRRGGVYLITGGLGRLGLALARYLARCAKARLVLTGRSGLPARETWGEWLATHAADDRISTGIRTVQELEAMGAEVLILAVDVADEAAMRTAIATAEQRFGVLHGVIHAAGLVGEAAVCPIVDLTVQECEKQFRAKVDGLYVLETVLGRRQLDFCLLLSSISTVLGGLGLAAYAAANCFMDAFARIRSEPRIPWISVNWGEAETPEDVEDIAGRLLAQPRLMQVLFSPVDLAPRIARSLTVQAPPHAAPGAVVAPPGEPLPTARARVRTPYVAPTTELERQITVLWQELLGVEQVGIHDNFFQLGGHSLIATRLISRLRQSLQIDLNLRTVFESPTVAGLALAIEEQMLAEIEGLTEDEAAQLASAAQHMAISPVLPAANGHGAVPLHYTLPNGMRILHQSKAETDHFYSDIFDHHVYMRHGITLREGACVFDVGANIGLFTLYAHHVCPTATVYAFEPAPVLFALLQMNIAQHGIQATLFNCGLSNATRTATFTFYPHSSGLSSFYGDVAEERQVLRAILANQRERGMAGMEQMMEYAEDLIDQRLKSEIVTCELRTLSQIVAEHRIEQIDLLKIDVQKSELDVLQGIRDEHWSRIKQVAMEVHDIEGRVEAIAGLLTQRGYRVAIGQEDLYEGSMIFNVYGVQPTERE